MEQKIHPVRFINIFLDYVENEGIFDEYDEDENCMVMSDAMISIVMMARAAVPERISNEEAAKRMRELNDSERRALIEDDVEDVVVDRRNEFAEKMAANDGARGVLRQLVEAQDRGDLLEAKKLMELAKEFGEK